MARRIAYLTAAYPKVSHTFIAREIDALRHLGFDVRTFSIRRAPPEALLTDADRRAADETFAIIPVDRRRLFRAHVRAFRARPLRYAATLARALRMSSGGVRANLWQCFYFAEAILLWDELEAQRVKHVHAHFANVASAVAMLAASFGAQDGYSWSFTMHGPTEFEDVTRFAIGEKIRSARFVACISDYCRAQLMKLVAPDSWAKLQVVHCGLDFVHLTTGQSGEPAGADNPLQVLCVGRLVPDKGQVLLLEAVARLREQGVPIDLTLVGDGPDRAALARAVGRLEIGGSVVFAGSLGEADVSALYRSTDVFCLPSFAEGVPVVLMEAMAHGLPVVATRVAGVSELVEDDVSGAVVSAGRVDLLVAALGRLAADPELRRRWGEAGRVRVRQDYDIRTSARVLAQLFDGAPVG